MFTKYCTECETEFEARASNTRCCSASCRDIDYKKQARKSYVKHQDARLAQKRAYYLENREKIQERNRKQADKNPQWSRENYAKHRDARLAQKRAYYLENKAELLARNRRWVSKNREKLRASHQKYRRENPWVFLAAQRRDAARNCAMKMGILKPGAEPTIVECV